MSGAVHKLEGDQRGAVNPKDSVWLSASAGTGKTQVLSARVLRLMLEPDNTPEQILCLTFTKAGAAEMALRVNDVLARWVRLDDQTLGQELEYLGAENNPKTIDRARTLFTRVLDCPGGGLRIDTIHAFAQWLLAAFPQEAGIAPGSRALEDRERDLLSRDLLAKMIERARNDGDQETLHQMEDLSLRKGPDAVLEWVMKCSQARPLWYGANAWGPPLKPRIGRLLGLPDLAGPLSEGSNDNWEQDLLALCSDEQFDCIALRNCHEILDEWGRDAGSKTGIDGANAITRWLSQTPAQRLEGMADLSGALLTKKGTAKQRGNIEKRDATYGDNIDRVIEAIARVEEMQTLIELAQILAQDLELGRKYALQWDALKERLGLIDFDDQIHRAAQLLQNSEMASWIRYKLDRQFDHILIDEAQDTNAQQWQIIEALIDDYFAGEGARDDKLRTIFTVGDYKQAIFGFQGTSPENFEAARNRVRKQIAGAATQMGQAAHSDRGNEDSERSIETGAAARQLQEYGLGQSFRSAGPILQFVDKAIAGIGWEKLGLKDAPKPHVPKSDRTGLVTIWPLIKAEISEGKESGDGGNSDQSSSGSPFDTPSDSSSSGPSSVPTSEHSFDEGDDAQQNWLSRHDRKLADKIATQIRAWMDDGFPLIKGHHRNAGPGDVLVLVRHRRDLASLIVARLYAKEVPVAGVDRLRLGHPLAVKDLMAALRFAAQPLDDLSLANLLVSPLIGWSQEQLLRFAYRDTDVPLWDHLRGLQREGAQEAQDTQDAQGAQGAHEAQDTQHAQDAQVTQAAQPTQDAQEGIHALRLILARADFELPEAMLHWILTGPLQGRRKLVHRLGTEANDPINELLGAAGNYAADNSASLQGFIQWFDSGDGELKRDASEGGEKVRVMTVHGSKGLQAPIVILADTAGNPKEKVEFSLFEELGETRAIPLPELSKDQRIGPLSAEHDRALAAELEEHWRLLYVAMTRAEEALFIAGSLGVKYTRRGDAHEDSWYARLSQLFVGEPLQDAIWGERRDFGALPPRLPVSEPLPEPAIIDLPDWCTTSVGPEPRPPRPYAPSSATSDSSAHPPFASVGEGEQAAIRGTMIHRLLERLPDIPPDARNDRADHWLRARMPEWSEGQREEAIAAATKVLDDPQFPGLFSDKSLAEAPLAALVNSTIVAGTVDRLLVEDDRIMVVDYKTTRQPPENAQFIPKQSLRQMAGYVAALEQIFPGRRVQAALLYTHAPRLIILTPSTLEPHKIALSSQEEINADKGIEDADLSPTLGP